MLLSVWAERQRRAAVGAFYELCFAEFLLLSSVIQRYASLLFLMKSDLIRVLIDLIMASKNLSSGVVLEEAVVCSGEFYFFLCHRVIRFNHFIIKSCWLLLFQLSSLYHLSDPAAACLHL